MGSPTGAPREFNRNVGRVSERSEPNPPLTLRAAGCPRLLPGSARPTRCSGGPLMLTARLLVAVALCLTATLAQAAGFRFIDVPADAEGPAIEGAMWYPCAAPAGELQLGPITLRGVKVPITLPGVEDCPISDEKLPLVVISHGMSGDFTGHHRCSGFRPRRFPRAIQRGCARVLPEARDAVRPRNRPRGRRIPPSQLAEYARATLSLFRPTGLR